MSGGYENYDDQNWNHRPPPVPEPRTYGFIFITLCLITIFVIKRWKKK